MNTVEEFIYQYEGNQRQILNYFNDLLTGEFGLTPRIQYNLPFYYRKSWICYLFPTKKGDIELAFTRGNELSNNQGLLKSRGRKLVSSIEFNTVKNIPEELIKEIIHEAILLDEKIPYTFPLKKGKHSK